MRRAGSVVEVELDSYQAHLEETRTFNCLHSWTDCCLTFAQELNVVFLHFFSFEHSILHYFEYTVTYCAVCTCTDITLLLFLLSVFILISLHKWYSVWRSRVVCTKRNSSYMKLITRRSVDYLCYPEHELSVQKFKTIFFS